MHYFLNLCVSESSCVFYPRNTRLTQVTHVQKEKGDPKRWAVFFIFRLLLLQYFVKLL